MALTTDAKQIEDLKGSFVNAIVVTPESIEEFVEQNPCPLDMIEEISRAVGKTEDFVLYAHWEGATYCFFPSAIRGGVCTNGLSTWTDCDGLDDLENRWNNEELWCN